MDARINYLQAELEDVMKIRQSGKYSGRSTSSKEEAKSKCRKCTYEHGEGNRCPAEGRKCNVCGADGHFARSPLCTGSVNTNTQGRSTTRRVEEQDRHQDNSSDSEEDSVVKRVTMVDTMQGRTWLGGTEPGGGDSAHQVGGEDALGSPGQTREQKVSLCQGPSERAKGEAVL